MELLRGSPADRARLEPGDVVVAVGRPPGRDRRPSSATSWPRAKVGAELRLTVRRDGRRLELSHLAWRRPAGVARKELGEILREADLISEAQLAEALALQKTFGERLASILVRQRILTEKFAVTYLGRQLGVPAVDLSKPEIDLDAAGGRPPRRSASGTSSSR